MDVRPYSSADREACLAIFDSNTPECGLPQERQKFAEWLDGSPENYFVCDHEGLIVACGGYALPARGSNDARLVWGMVGRQWQRQGIGRLLLMYRLRDMGRKGAEIRTVSVETTPLSAPFFAAQGFQSVGVTKDGLGPGFDKVEMVRKVAVCP